MPPDGTRAGPDPAAPRCLVAEPMEEAPRRRLGRRLALMYRPRLGPQPLPLRRLAAAWQPTALVVRNRTRVDRELLDTLTRLRVVGRLGSGLDNLDTDALRERGIAVVSAPGAAAAAVAELVFAYLLSVARPLAQADADVRAGRWRREAMAGFELYGKRLGVVGMGEVGQRVALRARAFGMRVMACDPGRPPNGVVFAELGTERADLDHLLAACRFVTLHVPLTPRTRGLIGAAALARMRPDAHLIVTCRGGVVDEAALADALRRRRLAGALLDVRESEPPPRPDPLADVPGLVRTPHIGGLTPEARLRVGHAVADGVLAALGLGGDGPASRPA